MTLGLAHVQQWRKLVDSLTSQSAVPTLRHIRITGVSTSTDHTLENIGTELESYANSLGIHLEFFAI